jgi:lipopolysaccharide/colanic/teichoic acid biosynthesis glycosyltransferase
MLYKIWTFLINIVFSIFLLLVFLIVIPFILVINYFYNSGSLFYVQNRLGLNGKIFKLYKFRSMIENAEDSGIRWATQSDSRVTQFGKFMRSTRIDEIPQVINLISGDINLIGPRAERPELHKLISDVIKNFSDRLVIKPGITGLAQIKSGYTNDIHGAKKKLKQDIIYISNRSISLDIYVLFQTFFTILFRKGF